MFVEVNGVKLHVKVSGEGFPIFIPNACGIEQTDRSLSAELRKHVTLVFYDMRGSSLSEGDGAGVTLEQLTSDLDGLRQALGYEKIGVLGHSAMGFFPLDYARAYPEHCAYAILDGAPPFITPAMRAESERYWNEMASPERKAQHMQNRARMSEAELKALDPQQQLITNYYLNSAMYFADPTYDSRSLWGDAEFITFFSHVWGDIFGEYDPRPTFGAVKAPVFVAMGRHDYVCPPTLWDQPQKLLPTCQVEVFEQSGHWPMLEEQAEFDHRLLTWMRRNPPL